MVHLNQVQVVENLKVNNVLYIPGLSVDIREYERILFSQDKGLTDNVQKNITLDPFLKTTSGISKDSPYKAAAETLMARCKNETQIWLTRLRGRPTRNVCPNVSPYVLLKSKTTPPSAKSAATRSFASTTPICTPMPTSVAPCPSPEPLSPR